MYACTYEGVYVCVYARMYEFMYLQAQTYR